VRWEVRCNASQLFPGLELDFMEDGEIAGTPQPLLREGDDVAIELEGSSKWLKGNVIRATTTEVDVDFGSEQWRLGPREVDDMYHPPNTAMRLRTWYARTKL
jgi:hypothetical protein